MGAPKEQPKEKYDYNAHAIVYASTTRPCLSCKRTSRHKANTCKN